MAEQKVVVLRIQMYGEEISMEHYRLHTVEEWPASPLRDATLAAIRSALARLFGRGVAETAEHRCSICLARAPHPTVIEIVPGSRASPVRTDRAA